MQFLDSCLKMASSPEAFEEFRRDGGLRPILEGGSQATLNGNLRRIMDSGGNDWLRANLGDFKKNDEVGRPFVFSKTGLGVLSPSVVQYASQLWDIVRHLKPKNLNRVVEVGGGYGGLARILSSQLGPKEYVLVDHPNVLALAQRYLGHYNLGTCFRYVSCFDTKSMEQLGPIDLFVSVAAMAELSQTQQELYNILLLKRAESFFVLYNTLHLRSGRSSFVSIASNWGEFKVHSEVTWENAISMIGQKSNSTKRNRLLRAFSLFSSIVPNFITIRVLSFLASRN